MTTTIFAKAVSFTDDDYSTLLGFADDPNAPSNYVMLNMTNEPDEQDFDLDLGGIHIDAGGLGIDGYDLVQDVNETDTGVAITLTANAAEKAGVDPVIEIEMESKALDGITLGEAVQRFKDRLLSWESAKAR